MGVHEWEVIGVHEYNVMGVHEWNVIGAHEYNVMGVHEWNVIGAHGYNVMGVHEWNVIGALKHTLIGAHGNTVTGKVGRHHGRECCHCVCDAVYSDAYQRFGRCRYIIQGRNHLTVRNILFTACTARFDIEKFCCLPTEYIYVFCTLSQNNQHLFHYTKLPVFVLFFPCILL
jgi:hypothetical protein